MAKRQMPRQKPGTSEQSVGTPGDFLVAVTRSLGIKQFAIDLAADHQNYVCEPFFTREDDSLAQDWAPFCDTFDRWSWLNPEFSKLGPWLDKCWQERNKGARIACLVPSSHGANWWSEHVAGKAYVRDLNGRLTFRGHEQPYPKDLALLIYAPFLRGGSSIWRWRHSLPTDNVELERLVTIARQG